MIVFNHLDFVDTPNIGFVKKLLAQHDCIFALIKNLSKNNNDKNQIYFHHDTSILNSVFDLTFEEREGSKSITKRSSQKGKNIASAIFNDFNWVDTSGKLHKAKKCKGITYHQYPEMRLSGFQTVNNEMPRALTVDYTKQDNALPRYLIIGATIKGQAVAMLLTNPDEEFVQAFHKLDNFQGSNICKYLPVQEEISNTKKLEALLKERVVGQSLKGCRLDKNGNTLPFTSTQVHGYTLEHALDIIPNADHDGDIFGIELKCFTAKKLSLITTEANGGLYHESFNDFMVTYGYLKGEDYRFTGIHRANQRNEKSGLTLKITCEPVSKKNPIPELKDYTPEIAFSKQMNQMQVVLVDDHGNHAACWSIERLMNRWGAKHNEVVYIPASVVENDIPLEIADGFLKRVVFGTEVIWCFRSTVENLINAIHQGIIFLDPAPKYNPNDAKKNKRRTQWRLNNIYDAVYVLYERAELRDIKPNKCVN